LSWCDKLASTPGAGIRLDPHYASSGTILDALSPVLDQLIHGDKQKFSMEKQDAFSVVFRTEDGFLYSVDQTKVSVEFNHTIRPKPVSGGTPTMEMLSRAAPYTKLLPVVSERLLDAALLVSDGKSRKLNRIGIIANTAVAPDELPPGVERFIGYIGRPWKVQQPDAFTMQITVELGRKSGWRDRCIHTLIKTEDPDQLLTLIFDWQRILTADEEISREALSELLDTAQAEALSYFEDLAEGGRFDEDIIRSSVGD
jgi:hypothetical protein